MGARVSFFISRPSDAILSGSVAMSILPCLDFAIFSWRGVSDAILSGKDGLSDFFWAGCFGCDPVGEGLGDFFGRGALDAILSGKDCDFCLGGGFGCDPVGALVS